MGLNFGDLYQTFLGIWTCSLAGFIFVKAKMFDPNDMKFVQYVVDSCFLPAYYFYMIANTKLNWTNWKEIVPVVVVQFFIHFAVFVYSIFGKNISFAEKYFKTITSYGFSQWDVFAYHILDEIGATKYQYVSIMYGFLDEFIFFPILKILTFFVRPGSMDLKLSKDQVNDQDQEIDDIDDPEDNPDVKIEVEGSTSSNSSEKVNDDNDDQNVEVDESGNPRNDLKIKSMESSNDSSDEEKPLSFGWTVLWAFFNARTVLIVIGLIYSATVKISMPDYINELSKSLRAPTFPATLFLLGVQVANTKLNVWTPGILISIFERYVFCPLIMAGLCRGLNIDSLVAKGMVMMSISPPNNRSHLAMGDSEAMEKPKAIYAWTMLLWLPMSFIWGAIIIKTNLV